MSFPPDVVAAVLHHMNNDHADDTLVICRALGAQPDATAAVMTDLDADTASFDATVGGVVVPIRIAFSQHLTERPQIRAEVTRMYHESCALLGLPVRPDAPPDRPH